MFEELSDQLPELGIREPGRARQRCGLALLLANNGCWTLLAELSKLGDHLFCREALTLLPSRNFTQLESKRDRKLSGGAFQFQAQSANLFSRQSRILA